MNDLLDEQSAAQTLRLKPKTLSRWRWEGKGPAYHKIGAAVRYRRDDLEDFISANRIPQND